SGRPTWSIGRVIVHPRQHKGSHSERTSTHGCEPGAQHNREAAQVADKVGCGEVGQAERPREPHGLDEGNSTRTAHRLTPASTPLSRRMRTLVGGGAIAVPHSAT